MYKIEKTGINTTGYDSVFPGVDTGVIMTDISSGNDFILEPTLPEDYELIVRCDHYYNLQYHLTALKKTRADIVLVDKVDDEYLFLKENGYIGELGLNEPKSVKDIVNNPGISWITLRMGPLNFDYEIIKHCEKNDIKVMGLYEDNPKIPLTFGLSFYARYCNIVLLPVLQDFKELQEYLIGLVGMESPIQLEMTKSIHKSGSIDIGASLKLSEDLIIPCPEPKTLLSPDEVVFKLGGFEDRVPEKKEPEEGDDVEKCAYNLWESMEKEGHDRGELLNLLRYRLAAFIHKPYNIGKISKYAVVFVIKYKKKDLRNYLAFITAENELYFSKLENAEMEG